MPTFLLERVVPATFDFNDPDTLARHCRRATDGYLAIGASWLGGVITDQGMFSLVAARSGDDLRRYARGLGVADDEMRLRQVLRPLGPFMAS